LKKTRIYDGKILGLNVYDLKVGGRMVRREIIEHPGAAAVIAFDEDGRLILVRQHRFPHGHVLEIPAGTLEKGEEAEECAMRELREETGYSARRMTRLITYYPSIGYNTEAIHCYIASGVRKAGEARPDEDEVLSVEKISIRRVMQMIRSGRIQDSKTICAVMVYASRKKLL